MGCRTGPPSGAPGSGVWPDQVLKGGGGGLRLLADQGVRWQSPCSGWEATRPESQVVLARRPREKDWAIGSVALSEVFEGGGLAGISVRDRLCFCQDTSSFFSWTLALSYSRPGTRAGPSPREQPGGTVTTFFIN